jgi:hypothetical protein
MCKCDCTQCGGIRRDRFVGVVLPATAHEYRRAALQRYRLRGRQGRESSCCDTTRRSTGRYQSGPVHRLHLTLISTLSALPLSLVSKASEEVYRIITTIKRTTTSASVVPTPTPLSAITTTTRKRELTETLFREILGVGDRETRYAMSWWYKYRILLLVVAGDVPRSHHDGHDVGETKAVVVGIPDFSKEAFRAYSIQASRCVQLKQHRGPWTPRRKNLPARVVSLICLVRRTTVECADLTPLFLQVVDTPQRIRLDFNSAKM